MSAAAQTQALLKDAVYGHLDQEGTTPLLDRLFAHWFRRLVYTQTWEDPAVDLEAMQLKPESHVVAIASAGCNVLSYLTQAPIRVTAVDVNHAHLALLRLKLAAIRGLSDHDDFQRFFASGFDLGNVETYDSAVAHHLDLDSRAYWEEHAMGRRRIAAFSRGFYRHGLLGGLIGALHLMARLHGVRLADLLKQPTVEAQAAWFDGHVAPIFDGRIMKAICSSPFAVYNLGIPPRQFEALCGGDPSSMARVLKERARNLATVAPVRDNYFAWQAYGRGYDDSGRSAVPPYLERQHYRALRIRVDRVSTVQDNIREALARQPSGSVDRVVLLDAQDWMSGPEIVRLWQEIDRTARPEARVIFRTAGARSPLPGLLADDLASRWTRDDAASEQLGRRDRSGIYGAFHLYRLA